MSALATVFAEPAMLLPGLLLAALAAGALVFSVRRRAARTATLVSPALAAKAGLAPAGGFPAVAAVLTLLVVLGLGGALARPRWGKTAETAQRRGADVVFVLDTSASMRAADVSPSRFVLARQAAQSLLSRLGSDRAALIACEGEAQALVPLTLDAAAVGLFLDAMEPGMGAKPGTSLAAGLAAAAEMFPAGSAGGRNAVVFSDGEDLEGGVDAAIARAKAEGITVHAVFVGAPGGSRSSGARGRRGRAHERLQERRERPAGALEGRSRAPSPPRGRDGRLVHRRLSGPHRSRGRRPADRSRRAPPALRGTRHLARRAIPDSARRRGGSARTSFARSRTRAKRFETSTSSGFLRNLLRRGKREAPELGQAATLFLAMIARRERARRSAAAGPGRTRGATIAPCVRAPGGLFEHFGRAGIARRASIPRRDSPTPLSKKNSFFPPFRSKKGPTGAGREEARRGHRAFPARDRDGAEGPDGQLQPRHRAVARGQAHRGARVAREGAEGRPRRRRGRRGFQHGPDSLPREAVRARGGGLPRGVEAPSGGRGRGLELRAVRAPRRGRKAEAERAAEGQEGPEGRQGKDRRKGREGQAAGREAKRRRSSSRSRSSSRRRR